MSKVEPTSSVSPASRSPAKGLSPVRLRLLILDGKTPGAPAHIAAASGVAVVGSHVWVVADDEHFVASFRLQGSAPGRAVRIFAGELPADVQERKKHKADLETLLVLPGALVGVAGHALLGIPSGSKERRSRGTLLGVNIAGAVLSPPREVSFAPLVKELDKRIPGLNLEGGVVVGTTLRLVQRGNGKEHVNALVDLDLAIVAAALRSGAPVPASALRAIHRVDLGTHAGVAIGFTDASALPDGRIVFTAAAEAGKDTVADGEVVYTGIGILSPDGKLERLERLEPTVKMEGVRATLDAQGRIALLLVSDADDPTKPAGLYRATL